MDIGSDIHKEAEKQEEVTAEQLVQVQADLREANQLLGALKNLSENFDWQTFHRILIEPTKEKLEKTVKGFTEQIKEDAKNGIVNPAVTQQIVYHTAFLDVLKTLTDFEALRKKYANETKRLKGRLQELEKKHNA